MFKKIASFFAQHKSAIITEALVTIGAIGGLLVVSSIKKMSQDNLDGSAEVASDDNAISTQEELDRR